MKIRELINEIKAERARQRNKWGRQRLSLRVWAWVWLEEVGEYYQAKLELRAFVIKWSTWNRDAVKMAENKDKEFIQILAVMVAFVEEYRPWHGIWRIH